MKVKKGLVEDIGSELLEMKRTLKIPREERKELAKYMPGICNFFNGNYTTISEAISEAESNGLKGTQAVNLIEQKMNENYRARQRFEYKTEPLFPEI